MVPALYITLLAGSHDDRFTRVRTGTNSLQGRHYFHGVQQEGLGCDFSCEERSHVY